MCLMKFANICFLKTGGGSSLKIKFDKRKKKNEEIQYEKPKVKRFVENKNIFKRTKKKKEIRWSVLNCYKRVDFCQLKMSLTFTISQSRIHNILNTKA